MRLRWLACAAIFSGAFGCGSSPDGTALDRAHQCPAGATCMVGAGGGPETGGAVIGAGGIIPFGSGGAAGSSMGGVSGFLSTGGDSFSTGGAGLPDGSIGSGGQGGAAGTCPAGNYSGTYEGMYGGGILGMNPVNGDIEFTIDANGSVTGKYTGRNPNNSSKADLVGTLDCTTFALSMTVENGTYQLLGTVRFSGTMPGKYSPETRSFTGTWSLSDTNSQTGTGTWTAQ